MNWTQNVKTTRNTAKHFFRHFGDFKPIIVPWTGNGDVQAVTASVATSSADDSNNDEFDDNNDDAKCHRWISVAKDFAKDTLLKQYQRVRIANTSPCNLYFYQFFIVLDGYMELAIGILEVITSHK